MILRMKARNPWRKPCPIITLCGKSHTYYPGSGNRGSTVVKVLCCKSEGRWFDHVARGIYRLPTQSAVEELSGEEEVGNSRQLSGDTTGSAESPPPDGINLDK